MSRIISCTHCENQLRVKEEGGQFRCPVCGGVVQVAALPTPKDLADELAPLPVAQVGADGKLAHKAKCPGCGYVMWAGSVVCANCGFDVKLGRIPSRSRHLLTKLAVGCCLLIGVVVLVIVIRTAMQVSQRTLAEEQAETEAAAPELAPLPPVPTDRPLVDLRTLNVPAAPEKTSESAKDAPAPPDSAEAAAH